MQKKIIALAVAALASSAAFAQSNVTVYGVVDLGEAVVKSSDVGNTKGQSSVGRLDSNSSYIGFKGVEDLGNGLKAVFQYETGFSADNGGALAGGRDSFVGLTGGFGTVVGGNLTHALRTFAVKTELMPAAAGLGTTQSVIGTVAGVKTGADERAANAIAYVSPSFAGFSGTFAYINGENKTNSTNTTSGVNQRAWQLAAQYDNGPLFAGIGYHRAIDTGAGITYNQATDAVSAVTIGAVPDTHTGILRLAVAYTLPTQTKLTALFDRTKSDLNISLTNPTASDTAKVKRNAWSLGVAQPFGKNTIGLEYAKASNLKADGETIEDTNSHIVSAIYTYDLSKRTTIHARYSKLTNDTFSANNFYNNAVANPTTLSAGSDVTGYMVGLRHTF